MTRVRRRRSTGGPFSLEEGFVSSRRPGAALPRVSRGAGFTDGHGIHWGRPPLIRVVALVEVGGMARTPDQRRTRSRTTQPPGHPADLPVRRGHAFQAFRAFE